MRSFTLLATLFLLFTTFSAAWPWPRFLPDVDSLIVRRQEDGDSKDEATTTQAPAKASATTTASFDPDAQSQTVEVSGSMTITKGPSPSGSSKPTGTNSADGEDEDNTESGSKSGSKSGSGSSSRRSTSSKTRTSTRKQYDARYPAGGITILEPKPTAAVTPLYKIGESVSFKFSMTSCSQYPTAVNVLATCTQNNALYTIAANSSYGGEGKDKDVVWDTSQYGNTQPMLTAEYTLIIYDADGELEDIGESGYLAPFGNSRYPGFKFDLYEKRPYQDEPGEGVKCATCSAGTIERVAKWMALAMGMMAIAGANLF